MGHDPPHSSQVIARKRAVFALRAEFSSLSFPKEKETKKKENLRAAPLKIPLIVQSCHAQSKTVCLLLPQLRVALRYPSGEKNCTKREEKVGATIGRPRLRRAFAVKMNSDGQNSFSHYLCYVELTPSAQELSPLNRRSR